jgi:hypothetical protein
MEVLKDAVLKSADSQPIYCKGCEGIFNQFSKIEKEGEDKFWPCEFCSYQNKIEIEESKID